MAVEILERDLGVPVRKMERSDIAYDVHIRRVFLRTRLADRDDRDHMIAVARQLHPARPGELDLPTWFVGRGWCHPGVPDCASCPLTEVCPKEIERAAHVTSG
jgi:endonuclease III